jgi:hypothetical protein
MVKTRDSNMFGIDMIRWCREHEQYVAARQAAGADLSELLAWHEKKLAWLQHERLIHLLVTMLSTGVFFCAFYLEYVMKNVFSLAFLLIMLFLCAFYLVHYFRLENTVQRWYQIAEELHRKTD